jgi:hypothetical protein
VTCALDRLQAETDPAVYWHSSIKMWVYLHARKNRRDDYWDLDRDEVRSIELTIRKIQEQARRENMDWVNTEEGGCSPGKEEGSTARDTPEEKN